MDKNYPQIHTILLKSYIKYDKNNYYDNNKNLQNYYLQI